MARATLNDSYILWWYFIVKHYSMGFDRLSDDVKKEALEEAQRTYAGFIKFLKWLSVIWIVLILTMCANNFLDDPTASQSDPAWREDYNSNMGLDE